MGCFVDRRQRTPQQPPLKARDACVLCWSSPRRDSKDARSLANTGHKDGTGGQKTPRTAAAARHGGPHGRRYKPSHHDQRVCVVRRQMQRRGHTRGVAGARRRAQLREQRGRPAAQGRRGAAEHSQQFHVRFSGVFCAALCQARRLAKRRAVVFRGVLEHQNVLGNWNIPRDHEPPPPPSVGSARRNWLLRVPPLRESVQKKGNAAAPQM